MTCEEEEQQHDSITSVLMTPEHLYNMVCAMEQENKETEAAIKVTNQEIDNARKAIANKSIVCTSTEKEINKLSQELLNAQREFVSVEAKNEAVTRVRAKLETENRLQKTLILQECCNTVANCTRRYEILEETNAGDLVVQLQQWINTYQSLFNKLKEFKELLLTEKANPTHPSCEEEGNIVEEQKPIEEEQQEELLNKEQKEQIVVTPFCPDNEQSNKSKGDTKQLTAAKMRKQVTFADIGVENVVHVSAYNVNRQYNATNHGIACANKDCHEHRNIEVHTTVHTSSSSSSSSSFSPEMLNTNILPQTNLDATCAALTREHYSSGSLQRISHLPDAAYRAENDVEHTKRFKADECDCEFAERKADVECKMNTNNVKNVKVTQPNAFTRNSSCKPRRTVWRTSSTSLQK